MTHRTALTFALAAVIVLCSVQLPVVEADAQAPAGGDFGQCKTCVFVLERIKKGTNMLLPAICSELYINYPTAYGAVCSFLR